MGEAKMTVTQYELLEILSRRDHECLVSYRPGKTLIARGFATVVRSGSSLGCHTRTLRITDAGLVSLGVASRTPKIEESAS